MKKKILGLVACLGIALLFAINMSINLSKDHSTNGLALRNIEALASGEVPGEGGSFPATGPNNDRIYAYRSGYYDKTGRDILIKRVSESTCIGQDHYLPNEDEYVYKCY